MAKNSATKDAKKRVKVQELPVNETKLSDKEMKKVKGGVYIPDPAANAGTYIKSASNKIADVTIKSSGGTAK